MGEGDNDKSGKLAVSVKPTEKFQLLIEMLRKIFEFFRSKMFVLEQKNKSGEWPRQTRTRSLSSSSGMNLATSPVSSNATEVSPAPSFSFSSRQRHLSTKPGLCGLSNIGNTCFMNSALQCLSNTTPLTKYFLSGTYKHELNPTNPLGMHGKIAEAYANLIHNLWGGQNAVVTPRQFKTEVGRFAPQFSGYQQQDSHELLAFLLDGLHEDLNRVKQKPYIEMKDDMGRPDDGKGSSQDVDVKNQIVAAEAWKNHSLRNSSIIVDNFHGQFKSTVECPVCNKRSVTFDPFCYLSLPLPIKKERNLKITFIPLDTFKKPIKLKVTVPKVGNTVDLINIVAKLTGSDADKLVVTDVFGSKFHKRFANRDSLSQITDRDDIFVKKELHKTLTSKIRYEIPINASNADHEELLVLPVYLREIKPKTSQYSYSYSYSSKTLFGIPLLVPIPRANVTTKDLYKIILRAMRRFVTNPSSEDAVEDETLKDKAVEDETMEEEEESDNETKLTEDSQQKEKDDSESTEQEADEKKPHDPVTLFDIKLVNSAGTQDITTLSYDDEEPLKLSAKTHLAIDWYPKLKKKYYEDKTAEDYEEHTSIKALPPTRKSIQLNDCLELFLQREKLGEEDPWFCPQCKEHRQAFKKFDLWTLPKVLVIHLKRFSYNRYWRDKIDALVDFPLQNLDLTKYVINEKHPRAVYDLHAVANHYGGLGGGHYTAYGINCYDGQWHYFDDSSVSTSDSASPVSKAAYVLFYTRREDPDNEMMNVSELLTEENDVFDGDDDEEEDNDDEAMN